LARRLPERNLKDRVRFVQAQQEEGEESESGSERSIVDD
jgi:hypothetical protein